ncbi:MAG: hypothetical protein ACFCUV_21610 [Rivularia sp. (in: cyanobacteria)]
MLRFSTPAFCKYTSSNHLSDAFALPVFTTFQVTSIFLPASIELTVATFSTTKLGEGLEVMSILCRETLLLLLLNIDS